MRSHIVDIDAFTNRKLIDCRFIRSRNAVDKDALECLPHRYMDQYPSFENEGRMVQQNRRGAPVRSFFVSCRVRRS